MAIFLNWTTCGDRIKSSCNFSIGSSDKTELDACHKLMTGFRTETESCKGNATNCACWADVATKAEEVKKCRNVGKQCSRSQTIDRFFVFFYQPKLRRKALTRS